MTETDNASSPLLTEDAYARSIGKAGKVPNPGTPPDEQSLVARFLSEKPFATMLDIQRVRDYAQHTLDGWIRDHEQWSRFMDGYLAWRTKQVKQIAAQNNGTQLGAREFTLTYGTHYETPDEAQRVMAQAIDRLKRYYKDEIIEFHAIGEYTQAGRPHVHGWYHLTGGLKITDKNFKRAYPPWNPKKKLGRGFEGGHHATIERVSDFHGYTEKHLEEAWLVENITNANDNSGTKAPSRILEGKYDQSPQGAHSEEVARAPSTQSRGIYCEDSDEPDC